MRTGVRSRPAIIICLGLAKSPNGIVASNAHRDLAYHARRAEVITLSPKAMTRRRAISGRSDERDRSTQIIVPANHWQTRLTGCLDAGGMHRCPGFDLPVSRWPRPVAPMRARGGERLARPGPAASRSVRSWPGRLAGASSMDGLAGALADGYTKRANSVWCPARRRGALGGGRWRRSRISIAPTARTPDFRPHAFRRRPVTHSWLDGAAAYERIERPASMLAAIPPRMRCRARPAHRSHPRRSLARRLHRRQTPMAAASAPPSPPCSPRSGARPSTPRWWQETARPAATGSRLIERGCGRAVRISSSKRAWRGRGLGRKGSRRHAGRGRCAGVRGFLICMVLENEMPLPLRSIAGGLLPIPMATPIAIPAA